VGDDSSWQRVIEQLLLIRHAPAQSIALGIIATVGQALRRQQALACRGAEQAVGDHGVAERHHVGRRRKQAAGRQLYAVVDAKRGLIPAILRFVEHHAVRSRQVRQLAAAMLHLQGIEYRAL
jgi:hypothetical protein